MKSAVCTERELLLSLRRFCNMKNCFLNAKPDESVLSFYIETMKMADAELAKGSAPDSEKVEMIVSNLLTVIDNAAVYFNDASKDHRKELIAFEVTEVDSSKVCRFLDESTKITARYQSAENKRENANRPSALKRRKVVRILKYVLLVLLAIGFLIFLSGYFFSDKPNQPESGNFFEKNSPVVQIRCAKRSHSGVLCREMDSFFREGGHRNSVRCWNLVHSGNRLENYANPFSEERQTHPAGVARLPESMSCV